MLLPPFEMALRAGARSVMASYTDADGVPASADPDLLTGLLRDACAFTGTVVSDYFAVSFLHRLHGVAGSPGEAAGLALDGRHRRGAAGGGLLTASRCWPRWRTAR